MKLIGSRADLPTAVAVTAQYVPEESEHSSLSKQEASHQVSAPWPNSNGTVAVQYVLPVIGRKKSRRVDIREIEGGEGRMSHGHHGGAVEESPRGETSGISIGTGAYFMHTKCMR